MYRNVLQTLTGFADKCMEKLKHDFTFFTFKKKFLRSVLTVIHFHASWAPQCAQMNDVMEELAKENTHCKFYKVSQYECVQTFTVLNTY